MVWAPRAAVKAPRLMAAAYGSILHRMEREGFAPPRRARQGEPPALCSARSYDMASCDPRPPPYYRRGNRRPERRRAPRRRRGHVIVHEAASFAGGRCRSYLDPTLGLVIETATTSCCPATTRRWTISIGSERATRCTIPARRCSTSPTSKAASAGGSISAKAVSPGGCSIRRSVCRGPALGQYFAPLGVFVKGSSATVGEAMGCAGPLYERSNARC